MFTIYESGLFLLLSLIHMGSCILAFWVSWLIYPSNDLAVMLLGIMTCITALPAAFWAREVYLLHEKTNGCRQK